MESLEARWKSQFDVNMKQSYYASSYSTWLSYGTSLISSIVENLQLKINLVHIRYEDSTTVPNCSFACGVIIRHLSTQSTDESWNPKYVLSDNTTFMRKMLELEGLSVYWDTNVDLIGHKPQEEMVEAMRKQVGEQLDEESKGAEHEYVLAPVSGTAKLVRNCSEKRLRSRSTPRISLEVELETVSVTLNVVQYKQLIEWGEAFSRSSTLWKYRKWRPNVPLKGNAKLWWKFGVDAHLESIRIRRQQNNWEWILKRAKNIKSYCDIYYKYLTQPEHMTIEMKLVKDRIECELSLEELCFLRELIFSKCDEERKVLTDTSSISWTTWLSSYWYKSAPSQLTEENNDNVKKEEAIMKGSPVVDESWLLDNLEDDTYLRRDAVFGKFNFIIIHVSFSLLTNNDNSTQFTSFIDLDFFFVKLGIETCPRYRSHKIEMKLGDMYVIDKSAENPEFLYLVCPQESFCNSQLNNEDSLKPNQLIRNSNKILELFLSPELNNFSSDNFLFELIYEKKPINHTTSTAIASYNLLKIRSRPLQVIYNRKIFDAINKFFMQKQTDTSEINIALREAARLRYEELKKQTKEGLQQKFEEMFENYSNEYTKSLETSRWEIDLDISAPQVLIPEDLSDLNSTLIVFDLGRLQLKNIHKQKEKSEDKSEDNEEIFETPCSTPEELEARSPSSFDSDEENLNIDLRQVLYERYLLDLSEMQVLVGRLKDNWHFGLSRGFGPMHVINQFSISLQMQRRLHSFVTYDPKFPHIWIEGTLPKLSVFLNEYKLSALLKCFRNVLPSDNTDFYAMQDASLSTECNINIDIQVHHGSLCLIDDCKDTDVPLFEIGVTDFYFGHTINNEKNEGVMQTSVFCDYFNRALSGWEPFLEPWRFKIIWNILPQEFDVFLNMKKPRKIFLELCSPETLNINFTGRLLEIYRIFINWFYEFDVNKWSVAPPSIQRDRLPFIPFALKNDTGCKLKFYSMSYDSKLNYEAKTPFMNTNGRDNSAANWTFVEPGMTIPFLFDESVKSRLRDSHLLVAHKIAVQVEGWKPLFPVSVDKVGVFFREAKTDDIGLETARIVFQINLENNARKVITVRSALLISNQTENPFEIKFDTAQQSLYLPSKTVKPVPLRLVRSKPKARPCELGVNFCETPLQWEHVRRSSDVNSEMQVCQPFSKTRKQHSSYATMIPYTFCVMVHRDNFPLDSQGPAFRSFRAQPAHTITLLPPVQVTSLLTSELRYHVAETAIVGTINSGQSTSIHFLNIREKITIEFSIDNFPKCKPLIVNPGATRDYVTHLELIDTKGRSLILNVQVALVGGGASALHITVYAPFWIINRTGLPLVVKQDGASGEAAGQFQEHEVARSISPLMFSFTDQDASHMCMMRLGRSVGNAVRWCQPFYLEKGCRVRRLKVAHLDPQRPDLVYELGIDVRSGRAQHRDTQIVTLSPRYQIENSSSYCLEFVQKFATEDENVESKDMIMRVLPNSNIAYHWPRTDKDRLLCVRISALRNCHWSGGVPIVPSTSFHLNIRDEFSRSHFLRVEILLQGATYFIVFTDANNLPPPIRIDNFSEVPIEFFQTRVQHSWMKSRVRPNSSLPYAWDDPTLKPHITVCAPGGSCATYDINSFAPGDQLTYDNYIYIAFTGTFMHVVEDDQVLIRTYDENDVKSRQLVLDVFEGTRMVFLSKKEIGKRSQLWRRDSTGRLIHEGSTPPYDHRRSSFRNKIDKVAFVLDVLTQAVKPGENVSLILKKYDLKRGSTQIWNFAKDGRLVCDVKGLCVQPRGGFANLRFGKEVILGPLCSLLGEKMPNGIPLEQAICTQKMRKGSGTLDVTVAVDGPTRVLKIVDVRGESKLTEVPHPLWPKNANNEQNHFWELDVQIILNLHNVGFSIINKDNEELAYLFVQQIILALVINPYDRILSCSVENFQVSLYRPL